MARKFYGKYDSREEEFFNMWLDELVEAGYIDKYVYQPESFKLNEPVCYKIHKKLKTKTKIIEKTLMQAREYTPDYTVYWNEKAKGILYNNLDEEIESRPIFFAQNDITILDIKGKHNQHSSWAVFEAARKDVWEKYGIFIEKIQPIGKKTCLFSKSFTPKNVPIWQKKDPSKKYAWACWKIRNINQFLKGE